MLDREIFNRQCNNGHFIIKEKEGSLPIFNKVFISKFSEKEDFKIIPFPFEAKAETDNVIAYKLFGTGRNDVYLNFNKLFGNEETLFENIIMFLTTGTNETDFKVIPIMIYDKETDDPYTERTA